MHVTKPKSKGIGIIVSDFVNEVNGYLRLSDNELFIAQAKHGLHTRREAWKLMEYGEGKDGYWASKKFLAQIKEAVKIADIKYPRRASHGFLVTAVVTVHMQRMHLMFLA